MIETTKKPVRYGALSYIADTLDVPTAARDLLEEFDQTIQRIAEFPYAHELTEPTAPCRMRSEKPR